MKVRSLKNHPYKGQIRGKGTLYEIRNKSHIKVLTLVKAIEPVNDQVEPEKTEITSKPTSGTGEILTKQEKRKYERRESAAYNRKDMQARPLSSE